MLPRINEGIDAKQTLAPALALLFQRDSKSWASRSHRFPQHGVLHGTISAVSLSIKQSSAESTSTLQHEGNFGSTYICRLLAAAQTWLKRQLRFSHSHGKHGRLNDHPAFSCCHGRENQRGFHQANQTRPSTSPEVIDAAIRKSTD